MRSRVLLGLLFGAGGGFLGFLLQEFTTKHDLDVLVLSPAQMMQNNMLQGLWLGCLIGIALGAVEGAAVNSPRLLLRGCGLGGIIGAIGGVFGIYFGSFIFGIAMFGKALEVLQGSHSILDFLHLVIARALGWTFLGAFPGLAAGAATLSQRRAWHGLIGGLLGGFIGGILFDLVAAAITPAMGVTTAAAGQHEFSAGRPSRAIGFTIIGALTGLFIGLVEEYLKQAWVRVLAGKNEGKDYIISKPLTVLGRDERADVPLFGDPGLAPQHAAIRMENGRHMLLDGGAPSGSVVNGQRIQQQLLRDGDMIQLGQVRILFREKATASKIGKPVTDAPKGAPQAPGALAMPSHLCPFCGAPKDAAGNCLCSVPGAQPGGQSPYGAPAPPPSYEAGAGYGAQPGYPAPAAGGYAAPGYDPAAAYGSPPPAAYDAGAYGAQPAYGGSPFDSGFGAPGGAGSRLVGLEGPYAGQSFMLGPSQAIGREPSKDIALTSDTTVSRTHAHIAQENGAFVVYDDGSSNGTFVNNVRIQVQALAPGDIVQFGASKFRYE